MIHRCCGFGMFVALALGCVRTFAASLSPLQADPPPSTLSNFATDIAHAQEKGSRHRSYRVLLSATTGPTYAVEEAEEPCSFSSEDGRGSFSECLSDYDSTGDQALLSGTEDDVISDQQEEWSRCCRAYSEGMHLAELENLSSPAYRIHKRYAEIRLINAGARAFAGFAIAVGTIAPLAQALSSHWPYFLAGGICAAISHTAAVPLDVVKTRIQCSQPGEYRGIFDAFIRIWQLEGARVLFCGAGATMLGYAMQGFLKFGFFEFLKPLFSSLFVQGASRGTGPMLASLIAASITAEVVGSSALTPLEAARIRMVAEPQYASNVRSGLMRMISEEGIGVLTRGLPAVLAKQVPYTVTKLVSFDALIRVARSRYGGMPTGAMTMACAVAAGILSSLASQPGDSLLSTLNSEGRERTGEGDVGEQESVVREMVRIARAAGISGLYRGTWARMLHVTTIVTVQLLIYQSVKQMVGITT